VALRAI